MQKAFTLMELLIVIALLGILAAALLVLFNPQKQIAKAQDTKRKHELSQLQRAFEDSYNDNSLYPASTDVCYDNVQTNQDTCSCRICGNESAKSSFPPYANKLPCDPLYPRRTFLYQYQCSARQWYKLYAVLDEAGGGRYSYNYGVSSQNIALAPYPTIVPPPVGTCQSDPDPKYCLSGSTCNVCGSFENCSRQGACNSPLQLYSNPSCSNPCQQ